MISCDEASLTLLTQSSQRSSALILKMSEGRSLTLRKKGGRKAPVSAPKQISGPTNVKHTAGTGDHLNARERVQQSETSDIVKRRYSTRYNQLPDFGAGAPAVPGIPPHLNQLHRRSRESSPLRPTTAGSSHPLKVDVNVLSDPNLHAERCTKISILIVFCKTAPNIYWQMLRNSFLTPRSRISRNIKIACEGSSIEHLLISNKTSIKTGLNSSRLVKRRKNLRVR